MELEDEGLASERCPRDSESEENRHGCDIELRVKFLKIYGDVKVVTNLPLAVK